MSGVHTDWKKAKVIAVGIDVGAVTSKAVILVDGQLHASSQIVTRIPKESALDAINAALGNTDMKLADINCVVGTGRGSSQVAFAQKTVSEIACGAAGAVHVWGPTVRTVLDAGGQSCRVIHCTEKGSVTAFLWNDKCAAGIGRSLETFGRLVNRDLAEMASIALQSETFPKLSDFCAVYGQSEALDLIRSKVSVEELIAAYHCAMAKRISTLVGRAGVKNNFVIVGGLAKNRAIINWVESILKLSGLAAKPEWDPGVNNSPGCSSLCGWFLQEVAVWLAEGVFPS